MRKSVVTIAVLFFILLISGCSTKSQPKSVIYYGESDHWIVIGTKENTFKFSYKRNVDDLMKSNPENKITFAYGTSEGSTVTTETLTSTTFYEVSFDSNFIRTVDSNSLINVQINYGDTNISLNLQEYTLNSND